MRKTNSYTSWLKVPNYCLHTTFFKPPVRGKTLTQVSPNNVAFFVQHNFHFALLSYSITNIKK